LPVWIGAYRFQGKVYQVAVNARTGEVQGERPYSAAKIALLIAVILLVIFVIVLLNRQRPRPLAGTRGFSRRQPNPGDQSGETHLVKLAPDYFLVDTHY